MKAATSKRTAENIKRYGSANPRAVLHPDTYYYDDFGCIRFSEFFVHRPSGHHPDCSGDFLCIQVNKGDIGDEHTHRHHHDFLCQGDCRGVRDEDDDGTSVGHTRRRLACAHRHFPA